MSLVPAPTYLLPQDEQQQALPQRPATLSFAPISSLRPGRQNFDVEVIVLESHEKKPYIKRPRRKDKFHPELGEEVILYLFLVADRTGSIVLNLFQYCGDEIEPGDILWITGGYAKIFEESESLQLYAGPKVGVRRVGNFTLDFCTTPNWSHFTWQTDPNDPKALVSIGRLNCVGMTSVPCANACPSRPAKHSTSGNRRHPTLVPEKCPTQTGNEMPPCRKSAEHFCRTAASSSNSAGFAFSSSNAIRCCCSRANLSSKSASSASDSCI